MDTSLAVDTLPHDLQEDEENGSAQLLGVWGVAAFLGSAIGPMIGGPLLYIFGSQTVVDDKAKSPENGEAIAEEYTLTGYAVVLSLSSFYFLCSAFSLHCAARSDQERHKGDRKNETKSHFQDFLFGIFSTVSSLMSTVLSQRCL